MSLFIWADAVKRDKHKIEGSRDRTEGSVNGTDGTEGSTNRTDGLGEPNYKTMH